MLLQQLRDTKFISNTEPQRLIIIIIIISSLQKCISDKDKKNFFFG